MGRPSGRNAGEPLTAEEREEDDMHYVSWSRSRVSATVSTSKAALGKLKKESRVECKVAYDLARQIQNGLKGVRGKGLEPHIAPVGELDDDLVEGEKLVPSLTRLIGANSPCHCITQIVVLGECCVF